ncbi:MAG TPA: phenylalanine--tRNA ligase subunit beta [Candidatus Methylacidiphilales bacterium]|jgi:phenylalanyl-tRNA synthetase beta chain|nr:phenylalanine--tRNA ligase subunit beta [Candidatus Methylacidiphilales bacterium]
MKFSLRWLSRYIDLAVPVPQMLDRLTLSGAEVEHVASTGVDSPLVVVAQILSSSPHPNADRLSICQVNDGAATRQIVCGAKNYKVGDKVPLALPGAKLPGGLLIKESKLRGELSQGMLCSAKELALAADAEGLLILPSDAPVGKIFADYQPGDTLFDLEITSNRPDLLSYRGLAREIAAIGAGALKVLRTAAISFPKTDPVWTAQLGAPDLGPYYSATHLTNVKVGPSPAWLQEAIASTGHRPINNVVDITNYVLFETGQPLHAFDAAKLTGRVIQVRRASAGEKLEALDDKTYQLLPDDLVIADPTGPIAIAGVMGGKPTGVTNSTTEIVLEAAWFLPAAVRRTSRRLGLVSDSSYRYERRVDPGALLHARDGALALLLELTGASVSSASAVAGAPPPGPGAIKLRSKKIDGLLGVQIPFDIVEENLMKLGCEKRSALIDGEMIWQPPSFRADLSREIDLIEELTRLHGLDAVPPRLVTGLHPETDADRAHDRLLRLRRALALRGWDECVTDALIERRFAAAADSVEIANPLSELQTHLRPALKTSLLQVAAKNLARGVAQLRLFEIGRVYQKRDQSTHEPLRLALLAAGLAHDTAWYRGERSADYFDLSGTIDFLLKNTGINVKDIVESGQITSSNLKIHSIKIPLYYAEIALDPFLARNPQPERYQPVPAFPPVRRDLAVVVPKSVPQARVEAAIRATAAPNLESVRLFDLFLDPKGEKIPPDHKSLAYALTYRAPDRTLTEREVNDAHDLLRKKLASALSCTFRE